EDVFNSNRSVELFEGDIIITSVGSWPHNPNSVVGKVIRVPLFEGFALLNQNMVLIRAQNPKLQNYLHLILDSKAYSDYVISGAQGSANQASVTLDHIFTYKILIPSEVVLMKFDSQICDMLSSAKHNSIGNIKLAKIQSLLLSKMAGSNAFTESREAVV
ncbi:hypothetical protein N9B82_06330, partial [Saprospiraceae bacterium]|nr:hypothetical protein [Saprospiraceae bacterium]